MVQRTLCAHIRKFMIMGNTVINTNCTCCTEHQRIEAKHMENICKFASVNYVDMFQSAETSSIIIS